jgi:hypothetical protein
MSEIEIKNFTRYNTDDLKSIIQRFVQHIAKLTGSPPVLNEPVARIEFHPFKPANPIDKIQTWNSEKREYNVRLERKYVGHVTNGRPERVPLLEPRLLWGNPIEALTSTLEDGTEIAPAVMIGNLMTRMFRIFNTDTWSIVRKHGSGAEVVDITGLKLRIEKKAAVKGGADDRTRDRLRKALSRTIEASYDGRSARYHLTKYFEKIQLASDYAKTPELANHVQLVSALIVSFDAVVAQGCDEQAARIKELRAALCGPGEEE